MKKLLILAAIVLIATLNGCVYRMVKTYTDAGQSIDIGVNREFAIILGSNPTTGFNWELTHDSTIIELVEKKYILGFSKRVIIKSIMIFILNQKKRKRQLYILKG